MKLALLTNKVRLVSLAAGVLAASALASEFKNDASSLEGMIAIARQIHTLEANSGNALTIKVLRGQYDDLREASGGLDPAGFYPVQPVGPVTSNLVLAPLAPAGMTASFNSFPSTDTPLAIPDNLPAGISSVIAVATADTYVLDVDVTLAITHTFNSDLTLTLQSPIGTVARLVVRRGGGNDNVFNGSLFDDQTVVAGLQNPVQSVVFVNNVVATPLTPEGALSIFNGQNPNGNWSLKAVDAANLDVGTIQSWTLGLTTLDGTPCEFFTGFGDSPAIPIPDNSPAGVETPILVSGMYPYLLQVDVMTNITHTFNSDLTLSLIAPSGKIARLVTRRGGGNDNVFNGTSWSDSAVVAGNQNTASTFVYANNVVATPLCPEGALGTFVGENPNGTWRLRAVDAANLDVGTINSWALSIRSGRGAVITFCLGDGSEGPCPCGNSGSPGFGCENAASTGGVALAAGSFTPDGFGGGTAVLVASGFPVATFPTMVVMRSPLRIAPVAFGDGLRCLGAPVVRVGSAVAVGGTAGVTLNHGAGTGVFDYQAWYRSSGAFCTPSLFNMSSGLSLCW